MFCGLKGRTRRPRRTKARARPATSVDLPTLEPVPWTMTAGVRMGSVLDAALRLDALAERVLDERHLGHEVGEFDQRRGGVAARDDHVGIGGPSVAEKS